MKFFVDTHETSGCIPPGCRRFRAEWKLKSGMLRSVESSLLREYGNPEMQDQNDAAALLEFATVVWRDMMVTK